MTKKKRNYKQGKYNPRNPKKYKGDSYSIIYRSSWEHAVFKWLDENKDIVEWSSEEKDMIVPYRCPTDGKIHRYFIDVRYKTRRGDVWYIEIKPKNEVMSPKKPKRKTKSYYNKCLTYLKNQSKWEHAEKFCKSKQARFAVWHEDIIKSMGIPIYVKDSLGREIKK